MPKERRATVLTIFPSTVSTASVKPAKRNFTLDVGTSHARKAACTRARMTSVELVGSNGVNPAGIVGLIQYGIAPSKVSRTRTRRFVQATNFAARTARRWHPVISTHADGTEHARAMLYWLCRSATYYARQLGGHSRFPTRRAEGLSGTRMDSSIT